MANSQATADSTLVDGALAAFGGLPFLDADFNAAGLVTAAACMRRARHSLSGAAVHPLDAYLDPLAARRIYCRSEAPTLGVPAAPAEPTLLARLRSLTDRICSVLPGWEVYFSIPIITLVLETDSVLGYSNVIEPQHVYLGQASCRGEDDCLLENYLHEVAHLWLYFLQEVWQFETGAKSNRYTLPSGTTGKSLTGTMDAAFVAAVLRRYYRRVGNIRRRSQLSLYLGGCVLAIRDDPEFTDVGRDVCLRLARDVSN